MPGAVVVYMPVHGGELRLEELHAVHPQISEPRFGMFCDNLTKCDILASVLRPTLDHG